MRALRAVLWALLLSFVVGFAIGLWLRTRLETAPPAYFVERSAPPAPALAARPGGRGSGGLAPAIPA